MRTRRNLWLGAVVLLVFLGTTCSAVGARAVARNDSSKSHQEFVASAMQIASTLQLAIQHEQDLTITAGSVLIRNPDATEADFQEWVNSVRAFGRYPELQTIFDLTMVTPAQLPTYAAHQEADPSGPLAADGTFQVSPPGLHPFYCLASVTDSRSGTLTIPAGVDYCQTALRTELMNARYNGKDEYLPYRSGKNEELAVGAAIYTGGQVPHSVKSRRAAFIGWTGTAIRPDVILAIALADHPSDAVAFHYGAGSSKVTFKAGQVPVGAQSTTISLHNGWHVRVFGTAPGGSWSNRNALALLIGGSILSWMLALLLHVLGTSRSRALQLVAERTNELQHQALPRLAHGLTQ